VKLVAGEGLSNGKPNQQQSGLCAMDTSCQLIFLTNFSIETIINFKSGDKNSGTRLDLWGFKDWSNYYYFLY
jgi:hypothetical protein